MPEVRVLTNSPLSMHIVHTFFIIYGMLHSFVEVLYCILTGLQGNGTLFVIVFTILFTIPACPQHKKYLPDRIHGLTHPQCWSVVVARLQIFVVEHNTLLPVF